MTWKDVLKFDRAKMRQRAEREEKEIDDLSPHQYSGAKKDQMSLLASIKRSEEHTSEYIKTKNPNATTTRISNRRENSCI